MTNTPTDTPLKLTPVERLILANQYRILSALNEKEARHYGYPNRIPILESGFEDHYHEIFGSIAEPPSAEVCAEVADILNLFDAIYESTNGQPLNLSASKVLATTHSTTHWHMPNSFMIDMAAVVLNTYHALGIVTLP